MPNIGAKVAARLRQAAFEFPLYTKMSDVPVHRYSGQVLVAKLYGFDVRRRLAILQFDIAGTRDVYLYETKTKRPGQFVQSSMKDWHCDIGTTERLRMTFEIEGKTWK